MRFRLVAVIFSVVFLVSACAGGRFDPENSLFGGGRVTAASANQIFPPGTFEQIDLINLIDPKGRRKYLGEPEALAAESKARSEREGADPDRLELALALAAFENYPNGPTRRNRIQDRILGASEQRCNLYKTYLKRVDTYQNAILGSLTTILGGAGAIFTSTSVTRALSGSAGITSGIRAELSQAFFSSVATSVIVPAIDLRRLKIRAQIEANRQGKSTSSYTLEGAILDAVRYHGACSIDSGLDEAGVAVKNAVNPGLDSFAYTMAQLNQAKEIAEGNKASHDTLATIARLRSQLLGVNDASLAGVPTVDGLEGEGAFPHVVYVLNKTRITEIFKSVASAVDKRIVELESAGKNVDVLKKMKAASGDLSLSTAAGNVAAKYKTAFEKPSVDASNVISGILTDLGVATADAKPKLQVQLQQAILDGKKGSVAMAAFTGQLEIALGELRAVAISEASGTDLEAALSAAVKKITALADGLGVKPGEPKTEEKKAKENKAGEPAKEEAINPAQTYVVAGNLNLRDAANVESGAVLGTLAAAAEVSASAKLKGTTDACANWLKVKAAIKGTEVTGWACEKSKSATYMKLKAAPTPVPLMAPEKAPVTPEEVPQPGQVAPEKPAAPETPVPAATEEKKTN